MRDLLTILDNILTESLIRESLTASEITKRPGRFEKFIDHIRDQKPFYTADGQEVVLDPSEADRFEELHAKKQFTGQIQARDLDGNVWATSKFIKTAEFGGAAVKPGEEGDLSKISKDAAGLKPSKIGITGKKITAKNLPKVIIGNSNLNSTEWGKAVIEMAVNITNGQPAVIPEGLRDHGPIVKAIVDNAGEYLGVLALVSGQSQWYGGAGKQQEFVSWLGSSVDSLVVDFPAGETNPLADSFATVSNAATGHTLNISSKGTGGGAAPALSKMKIPDAVRKKRKYKTAVDLIELSARESAATVGFKAMNLLHQINPQSVPKEYKGMLPWPENVINAARSSLADGSALPAKYQKIINSVRSTAPDGGRLMYAVKRDVAKMVNTGAIPEFEAVLLEILDMNFIQQYATYEGKKSGVVNFSTQWPAKLDGEVSMENKASANEPSSGGFSFKLHPTGTPMKVDAETGDIEDTGEEDEPAKKTAKTTKTDLDAVAARRSGVKAAKSVEPDAAALGRKRRR